MTSPAAEYVVGEGTKTLGSLIGNLEDTLTTLRRINFEEMEEEDVIGTFMNLRQLEQMAGVIKLGVGLIFATAGNGDKEIKFSIEDLGTFLDNEQKDN